MFHIQVDLDKIIFPRIAREKLDEKSLNTLPKSYQGNGQVKVVKFQTLSIEFEDARR